MRADVSGADLAPHTSAGTLSRLVLEWEIHCDVCPGPGRAVEVDRAAQGLDAVGEAGEAGTACQIGPAHAVVADRQQQAAVARAERNLGVRGVCVLHRVGQRFGCDVVRRDLGRLGAARIRRDIEVDWYRGTAGERAQRRAQAVLGKGRRVDPA